MRSYAQKFLNRLVNNETTYALQNPDGSYKCIRNSRITDDLLERHLLGELTLGIYAISPENTAKWICWDIDSENETELAGLIDWLSSFGINSFRESRRIGRSGHLFVFFEEPILSSSAFRLLKHGQIMWNIPGEVFPAQSQLKSGQVGSLVRCPLGRNRKPSANGVWGLFADCKAEAVDKQIIWFIDQPITPIAKVNKLIECVPKTSQISDKKLNKQHKFKGKLLDKFPDWDWLEQPSGELLGACPQCRLENHDVKGNNLSLNPETNVLYCHYQNGIHSFKQILKAAKIAKANI